MFPTKQPTATQACEACRRLKRRCSKEIPACSLCIRLGKTCEYSELDTVLQQQRAAPPHNQRQPPLESRVPEARYAPTPDTKMETIMRGPISPFPSAFFLDQDHFSPLKLDALSSSEKPIVTPGALVPESELQDLCERYFTTIHLWLPMISKKHMLHKLRLGSAESDACHDILLLCMKLNTATLDGKPAEDDLYTLIKSLCSSAESAGFISLSLVQSLVLLTVFEICHAIYPAAYLTIGRAARLGMLMGLCEQQPRALLQPPETWTMREQQRRTWWAIFILERLMSIEPSSLLFTTPEPTANDLLPINDDDWDMGNIVPSEGVFSTVLSSLTNIGNFARLCQASHMLSKVIEHTRTKHHSYDLTTFLQEAKQLHHALSALQLAIEETKAYNGTSRILPSAAQGAFAVCVCSRYLLYNSYACNENYGAKTRERGVLETEMQGLSLLGIKTLALSTVPQIAEAEPACPLLAHCLYLTATECAWFFREDHGPEIRTALGQVVRGLGRIGERWVVGLEYLTLLDRDGVFKLLNTEAFGSENPQLGIL